MMLARLSLTISIALLVTGSAFGADVDGAAAEALVKKSGCLKCHSVTQKKEAPAYRSVAEKYKGKADAEQALYKHLTTNPKVSVDGVEEKHISPKSQTDAEIHNLIRWVLSR
jgi:cytochrome c